MTSIAAAPLSIFLLRATGRTGVPFLSQALARGHSVTIFVRSTSKLPATVASHPRLRATQREQNLQTNCKLARPRPHQKTEKPRLATAKMARHSEQNCELVCH
jgi:hypothetical protein